MSNDRHSRCDICDRKILKSQHELRLTDPETDQLLGVYPAQEGYWELAEKFMEPGAVLSTVVLHPEGCGFNQQRCDGGAAEKVS